MSEPRIPPLPRPRRDPRTGESSAGRGGGADEDMTLSAPTPRPPGLLKRGGAFGGTLLRRGELTGRARELLIMRTAANTGAAYEWGHHVPIARHEGITDDEIARLAWPIDGDGGGWSPEEEALLRAADELHAENVISDATWAVLAGHLTEAQLIELCFVVGQYHMVAYAVRSLGIQPEPGLDPLP